MSAPQPQLNDLPLMSTVQVATRLGMSREQVWRLWTTGRLPGYKLDRHLRFDQADVAHFLDQHYSNSTQRPMPSAPRVCPTPYRRL